MFLDQTYHFLKASDLPDTSKIAEVGLYILLPLLVGVQDFRHGQLFAVEMPAEFNEGIVFRHVVRVIGMDIAVVVRPYPEILPVAARLFEGLDIQFAGFLPAPEKLFYVFEGVRHARDLWP